MHSVLTASLYGGWAYPPHDDSHGVTSFVETSIFYVAGILVTGQHTNNITVVSVSHVPRDTVLDILKVKITIVSVLSASI